MSMEQLKADLKDTIASVKAINSETVTASDLVKHFKFTLYPTLEAIVDEMDEIDGCVADMLEGAEDILQPETAEIFAGVIVGGGILIAELEKRAMGDIKIAKMIAEWKALAAKATETLAEITLDPSDADAEDGESEDDEEDDEDEDDEPENDNATEGAAQ